MVLTWPRKCVLLLGLVLVHAHIANNVGVSAQQQPLVLPGVSFDFDALSATPSPTPTSTPKSTKKTTKLTMAPAIATMTTTPATTAPVVTAKKTPAPTSKKPAVNADAAVNADTAVNAATGSNGSAATSGTSSAGASGTNSNSSSSSAQPTVVPSASPSPVPVVSSAAPAPSTTAAPAPTSSHECDATNTNLINKFYENNDVLEGDCAAANNYYRFPFEGAPSREQLINMSKTSACTVLMEALLQILPTECDFKKVALRSTAEAILQLAKDIKQKGTEALPSDKAITQAIETRRKDLLKIPATESATAATAAGSSKSSAASKSADAATTSSSGSGWKIAEGITSVDDDGQHILMDKDLLVVGTWSDNAEDSENGALAPATKSSSSSKGQERTETLDTKANTKNGSGSVHQFAALSVHAALLLSWVLM